VLKRILGRLTTPQDEIDTAVLRAFCEERPDTTRIEALVARQEATVVGEISSLRIVPRDGSPWLEATITDGTGSIVAFWTGRRAIAGVKPGRKLAVSGRPAKQTTDRRLTIYNPSYELL
jgi:RecG-like helicase